MVSSEQQPATKRELWLSGRLGICLLLAAATLAVYWPVIHCDFLNFDDGYYFSNNPHVQTGLTPANFAWALTASYASNWHPVTWLSLMLDETLFGKNPAGPHFTNLLLHAANTVLLFLLFRRLMGRGPDKSSEAAATWQSALVAALFALHPLHVESVAWVAERKDVLSAFFGLLALLFYTRYAVRVPSAQWPTFTAFRPRNQATGIEETTPAPDSSRVTCQVALFYGLSLLAFALALMSKPMLVTLPFVMLLLDYWPLVRFKFPGSRFRMQSLVVEKIPFLILSAASCIVTFVVQQEGGAVATLSGFSLSERVGNAFISYARYLGKTFWPAILANPYPHPKDWPPQMVLLAAALFVILCVLAVGWGRKFPFLPVGWFWFVGMLVPVVGLVQVGEAALADRYTYLPLIGIFLVLVRCAGEMCARRHIKRAWMGFGAALILAACAWRTRDQLGYWKDSGTLFRHALAVTENNYVACNNLGTWLTRHKVFIEAEDCFRESLRIKPDNPDALYNLGNVYARLGRWDEAIDHYNRALRITPAQADILNNLGLALTARGQFAEALTNFEAALKLNPDSVSAHNNFATVLLIQHHYAEAAQHFREMTRLTPDDPQVFVNLGNTLVRLGQTVQARQCYQEALRLDPGNPQIQMELQALGAEVPK